MAQADFSLDSSSGVLPEYVSYQQNTSSDENSDLENQQQARRRGVAKNYLLQQKFQNMEEALLHLRDLDNCRWTYRTKTITSFGSKAYYFCKTVRGAKCPCVVYLETLSSKVLLFKTIDDHDHSTVDNDKKYGIPEKTKSEIKRLFESDIRQPQLILNHLASHGFEQPSRIQLKNYLSSYKRKKFGNFSISLGELINWCRERSSEVTDLDSFVVTNHFIDHNDESGISTVRIFCTTKRLLDLTKHVNHLASDATYKLNWQGYPVLVVGSTDAKKAFHPFKAIN